MLAALGAPVGPPVPARVYYATVERWKDADTVVVLIDQGFDDLTREALRLKDCWAAELGTPAGNEALLVVHHMLPPGSRVVVQTFRDTAETFGRYVARIWTPDGTEIGPWLVELGYATAERNPK